MVIKARTPPVPDVWEGLQLGLQRCKQAYQRGNMEQAEMILQEIVAFAPGEARAWAWLGQVQHKLGKSEAEQAFERARSLLRQQQRIEVAALPLARLLWQQGDYPAACRMLQQLEQQGKLDGISALDLQQQWEEEFS